MKKNLIIVIATLLLTNLVNVAVAQTGYVVTLSNDTLHGEFKYPLLGNMIFIESKTNKQYTVSVKEFLEYYSSRDSINYVALKTPYQAKPIFLQRLENGKIKLFVEGMNHNFNFSGMMSSSSQTFWYASKDGEKALDIKGNSAIKTRNERKQNLYNLIRDYPELLENFKREKGYDYETIRAYIKKYNDYHQQQ